MITFGAPSWAALLLLPYAAAALGGSNAGGSVVLQPEGEAAQLVDRDRSAFQVAWSMRGAWLVQASAGDCAPGQEPCRTEHIHVLLLMVSLCVVLVSVICAFAFFREDKEEQITPLCPQLMVHDADLEFQMPLENQVESMVVTRRQDSAVVCKVTLDWPDPFRPGASGVAATVRVQSGKDHNLATVVARNVAMVGQGLALCRAGCEIFGFVEPEGPQRYYVRHRTGVHLLTLVGDFGSNIDIEGINPVGSRVFWFKKFGDDCAGSILQHFDAGLVICSILATHVHRRLTAPVPAAPLPAAEVVAAAAAADAAAAAAADAAAAAPQEPAATAAADPPVFPAATEGGPEGAAEDDAEEALPAQPSSPGASGGTAEAPGAAGPPMEPAPEM